MFNLELCWEEFENKIFILFSCLYILYLKFWRWSKVFVGYYFLGEWCGFWDLLDFVFKVIWKVIKKID